MDPELEGELEIGAGLRSDDWWQRFRAKRVAVPDVRGLFCNVRLEVAARASLRLTTVRLPSRPMPVEGLVVDQSPLAPARLHEHGELTIQVWHPHARP